jgi:hypothetical protein
MADAQAKATALARKEAELSAAVNGEPAKPAAPAKKKSRSKNDPARK